MKHLALRRVPALILLAAACHAPASFAQAAPAGKDKAAPPAAVVDAELLLRSCAGDAHRNAKLYVARAHGIELMKRSADRNQAIEIAVLRMYARLFLGPSKKQNHPIAYRSS